MQKQRKKMDKRCPRNLEYLPESFCPLAVGRLKVLRHSEKELTEEEENKIGYCPYAVNHQMANYCFFKLIAEHMPDTRNFTPVEIAHFTNLSVETVNKIEKQALKNIKKSESFSDIDSLEDVDGMLEL